jgi:hypothetical protein
MNEEVRYDQVISFASGDVLVRTIAKSYAEEGRLILVLDTADRILIEGKDLDTTGHKERTQEIMDIAGERGFIPDPRAVKHYASSPAEGGTVEYILVKW